jgi:hypothetical protein
VLLAAVAACLLSAGCDDSKNPLSDPQKSKPDARLTGVWRLRDKEGDVTYYHIGSVGDKLPPSVMRVLGVRHEKNGNVRPGGDLLIFPTTLGTDTYLNVIGVDDQQIGLLEKKGWNPQIAGFFLLKYQVEGDTLLIRLMDGDAKKKAIEGGKVKGVVEKPNNGPGKVEFTDTSENVARFVASAGDSLFSKDVLRLERVK